jgi:divalent metal cation (Fe/Co/Zn/Cd) transporter
VSLAWATGNVLWDGIGTLLIGVLLVVVAIVLAIEMKSLLLGESASDEAVERISAALQADPAVERVIHMKTLHLGPDELLVAAKIGVNSGDTAEGVARAIDEAEHRSARGRAVGSGDLHRARHLLDGGGGARLRHPAVRRRHDAVGERVRALSARARRGPLAP